MSESLTHAHCGHAAERVLVYAWVGVGEKGREGGREGPTNGRGRTGQVNSWVRSSLCIAGLMATSA